jgi:hypothetical protein
MISAREAAEEGSTSCDYGLTVCAFDSTVAHVQNARDSEDTGREARPVGDCTSNRRGRARSVGYLASAIWRASGGP